MTEYLSFDMEWLTSQLEHLPHRLRVAFAAACAERLQPAHIRFEKLVERGERGEFSTILARLWRECETGEVTREWVERSHNRVSALVPPDDEGEWVPGRQQADDFGIALLYVLGAQMDGEAEDAALPAKYAYESVSCLVANRGGFNRNVAGVKDPEDADPLVQAELARQRRDVEELRNSPDTSETVRRLKDRAKTEAAAFFGDELPMDIELQSVPNLAFVETRPDPELASAPVGGWGEANGSLDFDGEWLASQLERLPRQLRVAFAAACTERLKLAHIRHERGGGQGEPDELSDVLERLWDECEADRMTRAGVKLSLERVWKWSGRRGGIESPDGMTASFFRLALASALETQLWGGAHDAASAASQASAALWFLATNGDSVNRSEPGAVEAALRADRLVQAELTRQRRDVEELLDSSDSAKTVRRLRERAEAEAAIFFGGEPPTTTDNEKRRAQH